MRLNKFLSRAGIASRRKCDLLIEAKKVEINGNIVTNFGFDVLDGDIVVCNGLVVENIPDLKVYLVNKLRLLLTTDDNYSILKV